MNNVASNSLFLQPPMYQPKSLMALSAHVVNNEKVPIKNAKGEVVKFQEAARYEPQVKQDLGIDIEGILKIKSGDLPKYIREIKFLSHQVRETLYKEFSEKCNFTREPNDSSTWERFFYSKALQAPNRMKLPDDALELLDNELNEPDDIMVKLRYVPYWDAVNKERHYHEMCDKCNFKGKDPTISWEVFFNANAANEIVEKHPAMVSLVLKAFENYQSEQRNIIQNIFYAAIDGLINYCRDLKVTFQLISSDQLDKSSMGIDIFMYKTVLHLSVGLAVLFGTFLVVAAIATPFFASGAVVGAGAILGEMAKLGVGALIEFGLGGLNHFFLSLIWSDELESFEKYANDYRMKIFMQNQLKDNFNNLMTILPLEAWNAFSQKISELAPAPNA